ncbi:MAG: dipicolinate synthase subunit B [Clostridia bacterium]|nr:dipicolinate synthase subunit B [Clostridia bacterium]
MIGYAFCGSFCTFARSYAALEQIIARGYEVQPLMSENAYTTDTRFGAARDWIDKIETLCKREIIHTIVGAEPLGPAKPLQALVISPCTGNTLAKLSCGITDTAVCMAAKAHLRCDRPLVIALASNDAMSQNLRSIATLRLRRGVYFVPMEQDDPKGKPHSLVACFERLPEFLDATMAGNVPNERVFL